MAVHTFASTNINFSEFNGLFNSVTSLSNISMNTVFGTDLEPNGTQPHQISELRSTGVLSGQVTAETGGTVSVNSGYTQGATTNFTLRNVHFDSISSITITATATYPYTFHSFRNASGGGGSALSTTGAGTTTGTITLTDSVHTSVDHFYAYFTTTHSSP